MASYSGPGIVKNGLLLCLDAANSRSYQGSGSTVTNLINLGNGSLTNGVSFDASNNGVFSFNTVDNYISMGSSFGIIGDITLIAFIKRTGNNSGMIFSAGTYYGLFANGRYWYWDANPNWVNYYSTGTTPSDQWCMLGVSHSPGSSNPPTFFINDTAYTSTGLVPTPVNKGGNGVLSLGEYSVYRPYSRFVGLIGHFLIYNRALGQPEVFQNFRSLRGRYGI